MDEYLDLSEAVDANKSLGALRRLHERTIILVLGKPHLKNVQQIFASAVEIREAHAPACLAQQ